jgi:hypothetical protein
MRQGRACIGAFSLLFFAWAAMVSTVAAQNAERRTLQTDPARL